MPLIYIYWHEIKRLGNTTLNRRWDFKFTEDTKREVTVPAVIMSAFLWAQSCKVLYCGYTPIRKENMPAISPISKDLLRQFNLSNLLKHFT